MPQYGQQGYGQSAAGPIPQGDAFLVQTPEIDHVRDVLMQQQQQRQMEQMRINNEQQEAMARNLSNVRGADTGEIMQAYTNYKTLKQKVLFDPSLRHNAAAYNDANNAATTALADVYSKIDKSRQFKQMGQDLLTTQRTHPGLVAPDFGSKFAQFNNTPMSKLADNQLDNPDTYRFKDPIDFNKLITTASGKPQVYGKPEVSQKDQFTNTQTTYQYGNNPKQVKNSILQQLASNPAGEQSAANLMEQTSQSQIDSVNEQYAAENKTKWMRTTGQDQPIDIEPENKGSKSEQAATYLAKLHWLNSEASVQGTKDLPIYAARQDAKNTQAENMQGQRFKQQQLMEGFRQNNSVARINLKRNFALQDETGKNQMVDDNFNDEIYNAQTQKPVQIPTSSGGTLTGLPIKTSPVIESQFASTDEKGHKIYPEQVLVSADGRTYTGVYTNPSADGKSQVVDDSKTKQIPVSELKPVYRKELLGKPKGTAAPVAAPKTKVDIDALRNKYKY